MRIRSHHYQNVKHSHLDFDSKEDLSFKDLSNKRIFKKIMRYSERYSRSSTNTVGSSDDPGIRDEHTAAGVAGEGLNGLTGPTQDLEGSLPWELSGGGVTTYTGKGEKKS